MQSDDRGSTYQTSASLSYNGTAFSLRNATVFAIEDGKIVRSADYYDVATILTQLGLMPGAGATPVP